MKTICDVGSLPELRVWSTLLIPSDFKIMYPSQKGLFSYSKNLYISQESNFIISDIIKRKLGRFKYFAFSMGVS